MKIFDADDFVRVNVLVDQADRLILSSHVLAETSNLIVYRQPDRTATEYRRSLARIIQHSKEDEHPAVEIAATGDYERLGLTDATLLLLATKPHRTLLSDDLMLCLASEAQGHATINYNYLRDGAITLDQISF